MGENEQDETKRVDDQETSEAQGSDDQPVEHVEKAHGTQSSLAPVDDDVILK
jgi:hypothetical protein